jgi:hypothetical protein
MPFPEDMAYVRYDFTWSTTPEIQTFGMWGIVTNEGSGAFGDWQVLVDSLAELAVDSWWSVMPADIYSFGVKAARCVVYHYRQDHKEVLNRGEVSFLPDRPWKGSATGSLPPENTVVASLYGYDPAGYAPQRARKRGRIYLPTPAPSAVDGTGTMTPTTTAAYATGVQSWLNALTSSIEPGGSGIISDHHWRPYVTSTAGQMATKVQAIKVGNVIDTQRRRRRQLTELYETRTINV